MVFGFLRKKKSNNTIASPKTHKIEDRVYRPGNVIAGRYEVQKVFEGGLGRVYIVDYGKERFVLKTLKGHVSAKEKRAFEVEAQT